MNREQANEVYHQAELSKVLSGIESLAQDAKRYGRFRITSRKTIDGLGKLGYNCGYIEDVDNAEIWHIDWSD